MNIKNYEVISPLGKGADGDVYLVSLNKKLSTKKFVLKLLKNPTNYTSAEKEIQINFLLKNKAKILPIVDFGHHESRLFLCYEYYNTLSLRQWLIKHGPVAEDAVLNMIQNIAEVLYLCRAHNVFHLDITAANIVYNGHRFYLIDWTNCYQGKNACNHAIGFNNFYCAPEMYFGHHSSASEVYSLGCAAYYLASNRNINTMLGIKKDASLSEIIYSTLYTQPKKAARISEALFHLIQRMTHKNPNQRPSFQELKTAQNFCRHRTIKEPPCHSPIKPPPKKTLDRYQYMAEHHQVPYAEYKLGLFHEKGFHIEKNQRLALHWYQKAVSKGFAPAQVRLGKMLLAIDKKKHAEHAYNLFYSAAEKEYSPAYSQLFELSKQNLVTKHIESKRKLLDWCFLSAKNGDPNAQSYIKDLGYSLVLTQKKGSVSVQLIETPRRFFTLTEELLTHLNSRTEKESGDFHTRIGLIYLARDELSEADSYLRKAVDLYRKEGAFTKALVTVELLLSVSKKSRCYNLMGLVYSDVGEFKKATIAFEKARSINPKKLSVLYNLARRYIADYKFSEAKSVLLDWQQLTPKAPDLHVKWGDYYKEKHQFFLAIDSYRRALAITPHNPYIRNALAHVLLLTGEYEEGFMLREARLKFPKNMVIPSNCKGNLWTGEDIKGKTLLVYREQGIGDTIQYLRYLKITKSLCDKIIFRCNPNLYELCSVIDGIDTLITCDNELNNYHYDYHVSLLSLPAVFKTTPEKIPLCFPYITPPKNHMCPLNLDRQYFNIGIVWNGGGNSENNHKRNVHLCYFVNLLQIPNTRFYSLQHGIQSREIIHNQLEKRIIDTSKLLKTFTETALIVDKLDLVISVDTAVAHLGGALGKKVWMPIQYTPDYRWGVQGEHSIWYPSIRLFRETERRADGDWSRAFAQIYEELILEVEKTMTNRPQ